MKRGELESKGLEFGKKKKKTEKMQMKLKIPHYLLLYFFCNCA